MSSGRTARRLTRILGMLPWVIAHPGSTVDEICARFNYTRSELMADLNLVFVCGLPGYGPGDLMVAYIDEDEVVVEMADYFSAPLRLSAPEALSLLAAGLAIMSTGQAPPALERAVAKLTEVVLPDSGEVLTVDLSEPELVGELRRAAADGEVLSLVYTAIAGGATTTREVEPWAVFSTMGNWYVRAHCRLAGGERVFRVDRIRTLHPTGEAFEPPTETAPPVVAYSPGPDDVRAVIRLGPQARWVTDYYPVDVLDTGEGDSLVIGFWAGDPGVAARLLIRLGGDAELLEGDEVATELRELRSRITARYATG